MKKLEQLNLIIGQKQNIQDNDSVYEYNTDNDEKESEEDNEDNEDNKEDDDNDTIDDTTDNDTDDTDENTDEKTDDTNKDTNEEVKNIKILDIKPPKINDFEKSLSLINISSVEDQNIKKYIENNPAPEELKLSDIVDLTTEWEDYDTVLTYRTPNFRFNQNIIIADLFYDKDGVGKIEFKSVVNNLVKINKPINVGNTINVGNVGNMHNDSYNYLKGILKYVENSMNPTTSLILLTNAITRGDKYIFIKRHIEKIKSISKIPFLAIFATKPNMFMKPHTKMWSLVKYLYKINNRLIDKYIVLILLGNYNIKARYIERIEQDKAFANNIAASCVFLDEVVYNKKIDLSWNSNIMAPIYRKKYFNLINSQEKVDIIGEIKKYSSETFIIVIFGYPTSGKTTLLNKIVKEWNEDKYFNSKNLHVYHKVINNSINKPDIIKITKKINNSESIIIEGAFPNDNARKKLTSINFDTENMIIFIEVVVGMEISKLFNHVRIENAKSFDVMLNPLLKYYNYKGQYTKPKETEKIKYIKYFPQIETNEILETYRFC